MLKYTVEIVDGKVQKTLESNGHWWRRVYNVSTYDADEMPIWEQAEMDGIPDAAIDIMYDIEHDINIDDFVYLEGVLEGDD